MYIYPNTYGRTFLKRHPEPCTARFCLLLRTDPASAERNDGAPADSRALHAGARRVHAGRVARPLLHRSAADS